MNEKIKELALQSGFPTNPRGINMVDPNETYYEISPNYYLISALEHGNRVYYDYDHVGLDYFWSMFGGRVFKTLEEVPAIDDYLTQSVSQIEILAVSTTARVVRSATIITDARRKAMEEIAAMEEELAKKREVLSTL